MQLNLNHLLQQAITAHQQGKLDEAERLYRDILEIQPNHPDANNNLGNILQKLNRFDEAEVSYKRIIEMKPDDANVYNNLGTVLQKLNRFDEAEANYRMAIKLNPNFFEAHYNLGLNLYRLSRFNEAEISLKKTIKLKPSFVEVYSILGVIMQKLNRYNEAEVSLKKAIELKPDYMAAHNNLGVLYEEIGSLNEAEVSLKKAIELNPSYAEAHGNIGALQVRLGKLDDAKISYKKAIEFKEDYIGAHYNFSQIKNFNKNDKQFIQMQNLYLNKSLTEECRCQLSFALGKASADSNQFENSFRYYSKGNAYLKKKSNYNIKQDIEEFKQIKKTHLSIKKSSPKNLHLLNKTRPIFILGMPRSGTTLIEQIISLHSKIIAGGELNYFRDNGDNLARGITKINNDILLNFRENYLNKIEKLSNGSHMITDKMTENFKYIGLIYSIFPNAKIIHVIRDPRATCWGNYRQFFPTIKFANYSYDLDDLTAYYGLYKDLMNFWEEQYGDQIYKLSYEKITTTQEHETKKLIKYLDLEWEDKCLAPQNNKRIVDTASNYQVRQKVYKGSSQRWRKFEPYLNGAFDHLKIK